MKNIIRRKKNHFTLFNISVIGAPGVDIEARRGTWVDEDSICFLVVCSADDGVETESDEDELEDDDMTGICDVTAPFAVVFTGTVGASDKLSSLFCLLGDDKMTSEEAKISFCVCKSFDWISDEECVGDILSI